METTIYSMLLNIVIELCLGYVVFFFIGYLILIPGKDRLEHVTDDSEKKITIKEIKKVRTMICFVWTIIILGVNLCITLI